MNALPADLLTEARSHLGQFTLEMARQSNVSEHALARLRKGGQLIPVQPRVYRFASSPVTPEAEVLAAVMSAGPRSGASHSWAAWLHGLQEVGRTERPEIVVLASVAPELRRVRVHCTGTLEAEDRTRVRGIPCTSGSRTVIDCATQQRSWEETVGLVDEAVCKGVTARVALHARATRLARGRRNAGAIRTVTHPDAEGEFWSWLERAFGRLVTQAALPMPSFNTPVYDRRGRIGYADALFEAFKVVVELEGLRFHSLPAHRHRDAARFNRYVMAGLRPLRFTWKDVVRRPDRVVSTLREALDSP